jgi:hypothetical protein
VTHLCCIGHVAATFRTRFHKITQRSDGSQPTTTFNLSLSESAGSHPLDRQVIKGFNGFNGLSILSSPEYIGNSKLYPWSRCVALAGLLLLGAPETQGGAPLALGYTHIAPMGHHMDSLRAWFGRTLDYYGKMP